MNASQIRQNTSLPRLDRATLNGRTIAALCSAHRPPSSSRIDQDDSTRLGMQAGQQLNVRFLSISEGRTDSSSDFCCKRD
ncbi:hypothetical protein CBR_g19033 [Chara braunii]|uniref:Uncharacterized protein n=1 Tax=Chara braunii TaxID=69332 RepID=A0A388KX36_CHABU|nr:hypothetical protein CBR_g19033 [Chara braunii]|eukprot:GBG74626.1 hypothetical protein CBR_g19033 [Chara braunii]